MIGLYTSLRHKKQSPFSQRSEVVVNPGGGGGGGVL